MHESAPSPGPWLLQVRNLSKSFPGVRALTDVSLAVAAGGVHALMGENGAGKSTLVKILAGLIPPDRGTILFKGCAVRIQDPHQARRLGVAMIHQELMPFPALSVAENLFMGQEPATPWLGWINRRRLHADARQVLARLGATVETTRRMGELSVGEMQTVEIGKAIAHRAELIIMDEPTSALSAREADRLFDIIRDLTQRGVAVLYISHKLDEVRRLADTVTVLRDGCHVATEAIGNLDADKLIGLMVGREKRSRFPAKGQSSEAAAIEISRSRPKEAYASPIPPESHGFLASPASGQPKVCGARTHSAVPAVVLSVRGLSKAGKFRDVSFHLRSGEVLGLAGLMGAGRTEIVNALYGLAPADTGEICVHGRPVRIGCPRDALRLGIGMVSEDRKEFGLVLPMSAKHNLTLSDLRRCSRGGLINRGAETQVADECIRAFGIKGAHRHQSVNHLSGGNQQKIVIAKALLAEPQIILLDEPTRGIDIGAKAEVHAIIAQLARAGHGVLLVSSELPELLSLSRRLLVLRQGSIAAELDPRTATAAEVMRHAMPR